MTFREAGTECLKKFRGSDNSANSAFERFFNSEPEEKPFFDLVISPGHENACILAMAVMYSTKPGSTCYELSKLLLDEIEYRANPATMGAL